MFGSDGDHLIPNWNSVVIDAENVRFLELFIPGKGGKTGQWTVDS